MLCRAVHSVNLLRESSTYKLKCLDKLWPLCKMLIRYLQNTYHRLILDSFVTLMKKEQLYS